ncbi:MAG: M16 family metallopeptidase [Gemmatimonadaceae bacterium]
MQSITIRLVVLAACATTLPTIARAQHSSASATTANSSVPLPSDPAVLSGQFPNGLRYYVRANHEPHARAELRLVVDAGSVLEDDRQQGLAHFLEHMMFRGTKHFERQQLVNYLESVGLRFGPDLNASTSFDRTEYMLTVPTDSARLFGNAFQILEDWAHFATLDSTAMVQERPVVMEEWRLRRGAGTRVQDKEFPVIFAGSRYAERLPIGKKEILDSFRPEDVRRFYRTWYRPDLMTVVAVGDFDPATVVQTIRSHFAGLTNPVNEVPRPSFTVPVNDTALGIVVTDKELTNSSGGVLFKRPAHHTRTEADFRIDLVRQLADVMLDARLGEIARRPNAPYIFASVGSSESIGQIDLYSASAVVPEGGIATGLGAVMTELERVRRFGFTPTEIDRERRNVLRSAEQAAAESAKIPSSALAAALVEASVDSTPVLTPAAELALLQRMLPTVTAAEINSAATDRLAPVGRVFVASLPAKPGVPVPTVAELKVAAANAATAATSGQLAAYVDSVGSASLVPVAPKGGKVVATRTLPTIGVTEWTLSNGVRVLVKPTDFKADQVIMSAYQPGGMSLATDADYSAVAAASVVPAASGVGTFTPATLAKTLAGKAVGVSPSISEYSEGFGGSASPRDLQTMMQLVYLYATAPRRDSIAFNAFKARVAPLLANRSKMPETAFGDTLNALLTSHSAREAPLTVARLDSTNFAQSYDFYRSRFADATGMTFMFVGNVTLDSLRPLVERWLGSLPASGHQPAWHDFGVRVTPGVATRDVYAGSEPKARTSIIFHGDGGATQHDRFELNALADYLDLRLTDLLRIEQGGTYGVSVSADASKIPVPEYTFQIGFGAAPERVDSLARTVFAVINSLKNSDPTPEYVEKVKESWRRDHEVQLRENGYWLSVLAAYVRRGEDPSDVTNVAAWMAGLDGATIRGAARKYLSQAQYVRVTLKPAVVPRPGKG